MKLNELSETLKEVEYFGFTFHIPKRTQWIATDNAGNVYGYDDEPYIKGDVWHTKTFFDLLLNIGNDVDDWRESLVFVGDNFKLELTQADVASDYQRIKYFGAIVIVIGTYDWIAVDESGEIYLYEEEPQINHSDTHFTSEDGNAVLIGNITLKDFDWRNSLVKITKEILVHE